MKLETKSSSGFTLVELMVALGIMAIIAVGVAKFSSNISKSRARSAAKTFVTKQNDRLLKFLQQDIRFQTALNITNNGLTMAITRSKTYDPNAPNDQYTVTYRTRCVPSPASVASTLDKIYTAANANNIFVDPCLIRLANSCPNGTYPEVFIDVNEADPRIPGYNPNNFPNLSAASVAAGIRKGSIGSALCINESGTKIQAVVSSIYLTGNINGVEMFQIQTNELLMSVDNIAGITLLPNE